MGVPPNLQSAMFVSSHVVYTFSWVFVPTWNKFYRVSHSEIRQCKKDKDLLSLGLQHIMNFLKNITADLDSSWSSKFERGNRRSQVNEPFNEKSSFNDRSNRSLPTYLPTYWFVQMGYAIPGRNFLRSRSTLEWLFHPFHSDIISFEVIILTARERLENWQFDWQ